jgi:hypothetical protein
VLGGVIRLLGGRVILEEVGVDSSLVLAAGKWRI